MIEAHPDSGFLKTLTIACIYLISLLVKPEDFLKKEDCLKASTCKFFLLFSENH